MSFKQIQGEIMQENHKELSEKDVKQFVNKIFQEVKNENKIKKLVEFQAMNKYLIMTHNQEQLRVLGRIVASNKKNKIIRNIN